MSNYRKPSDIQNMQAQRKQLVPTEFTNYDEYLKAQKAIHDHMFQQEAAVCQLCGYPMNYNGHKLSEREEKWSVHDVCNKKMEGMLDRKTGIARERQAIEKRAEKKRKQVERRFR